MKLPSFILTCCHWFFAFCFWIVILSAIIYVSNFIYSSKEDNDFLSQKRGLEVGQTFIKGRAGQDKPIQSQPVLSFAEYFANADAKNGKKIFRQCIACHNLQKDSPMTVGPHLYNIFERAIAIDSQFSYSRAMRDFAKKAERWDKETLNEYLKAPQEKVPGTFMSFTGIKNDKDRADLIYYLQEQKED